MQAGSLRKKLLWAMLTAALLLLTVRAVMQSSEGLTAADLLQTLRTGRIVCYFLAAVSAFGFIYFEGQALRILLRHLGHPRGHVEGFLYSAADIFFSAVTPSASGGQPASAYFMLRDRIPGPVVVVALLLNLVCYTLGTVTVGVVSILLWRGDFLTLDTLSKAFIMFGLVVLTLLAVCFACLLLHGESLCRLGCAVLGRCLRPARAQRAQQKLRELTGQYRECVACLDGHVSRLLPVYLLNVCQRVSQMIVAVFVHLAMHGALRDAGRVWAASVFAHVGSNCIPIPGGMGAADYILLTSLQQVMEASRAAKLELISRSTSFTLCVLISASVSLVGYLLLRRTRTQVSNI